ncbi:MAG TPA: TonB-dependent receptor [bacterium]|nr:TonB-dependent receptor [bacterium]HPN43703.1 TonB-dependent receptor [bacterium]
MNKKFCYGLLIMAGLFFFSFNTDAATTGKIAGTVFDNETNEPLPYAQIMLTEVWAGNQKTPMQQVRGTTTDIEGSFYIINIMPGTYTVEVRMIGYANIKMEKIRVSVNSTTNLDFKLNPQVIEGEVVMVTADPISFKKDQTSSVRNVSSDQIDILPTESMDGIIEMQAGVVNGHFRGGRLNEVSYLVDGLQVDDTFRGENKLVSIENDVIKDLEVITGTFNAEYGRAMSGIVNAVTKDGGNGFHGRISTNLGNYYTTHDDVYIGLKAGEIDRNKDIRLQLEGPIIGSKLTFFTNIRYQNNDNYLNAVKRFKMQDYSDYTSDDPALWIDTHNGDSSFVPLDDSENLSLFAKVTYMPTPGLKLSLNYTGNRDEWGNYSHVYKYAPDGKSRYYQDGDMYSVQLNQNLGYNMFHELKLSLIDGFNGQYLYEDPTDSRYIHDRYLNSTGPGFNTGGQDKVYMKRNTRDLNIKYDLTWQAHKNHSLKTGVLYTDHELDYKNYSIQNLYRNEPNVYENYYDPELKTYIYPNFEPVLLGDSTIYGEEYKVKPKELSGYLQDKMEFLDMVINMGVRYDYFDPNTTYPTNWRNPANQQSFPDNPEKMSTYKQAEPEYQISPRFGISYELSDQALLHFSYGHFFQTPPMYAYYQNNNFLIEPVDWSTQLGNPQLKAQSTVQYEVGLWQEIIKGMGIEVNLFYRDIYDLLSMRIITTYNQYRYGLYSNKDYGNVKGLEIKYDYQLGKVYTAVNYTLQYTRGNADNPTQTFTRAGDSQDPIARLIPMSWDQRHTVNLTVSHTTKATNATLTAYYDSGTPYTWSPIQESRLSRVNLYPNNATMPSKFRIDCYGYYDYDLVKDMKLRFSLYIVNLLDTKNELVVNGQTGRANDAIIRQVDLTSHHSLFNDYQDRINNPASFEAPRYVKFGIGLVF